MEAAPEEQIEAAPEQQAGQSGKPQQPQADQPQQPQASRAYSWLMMAAHLLDDLNQGALVAVIPFLVLYNGYSYAEATALLLASNAASGIIQPLFGWLGDKTPRPWLMAAGIGLAGVGLACVGIAPNYALTMLAGMVSGIGVAMFHPEAGRLANLVAGEAKGTGISIFAVGGKLGFTFGPLVAAAAIAAFGMAGTLVFLVPAALAVVVLLSQNRAFTAYGVAHKKASETDGKADNWGGFAWVMGAVSVRSIMYYAFMSFIPLFLVYNLGQEESFASSVISLFALLCAAATITSGWAGQKFGAKRLIIGSYAIVAFLVAAFALNTSLPVALALTVLLAFFCDISYPSAVALGQGFTPHHLGMASGLSFGVMVCIGGVMSPVLGLLGDACGLQVVMFAIAALAVLGIAIAAFIPKQED